MYVKICFLAYDITLHVIGLEVLFSKKIAYDDGACV